MFHLLFWIIQSFLIIIIIKLSLAPANMFIKDGLSFSLKLLEFLNIALAGAVVFYAAYFSLRFFEKRPIRFLWLVITYLIIISGVIIYDYFDAIYYDSSRVDFWGILTTFFHILYFNVFGFLFSAFIEWIKDRKIKAELEKDKIASQLELLKSQINPHFLFNSLNNIDVLIEDDSQKASEYLKKLSEILRFMLYESNTDKIPLIEEIEYIEKYIDLQKIRTSNDNFVKFEIYGNANDKFIAPMIFIHFIENAFKHSTNKKIENAINIRFDISENQISFFCKNHNNTLNETSPNNNGLGIKLIKQKLDLIYKKDYTLDVKKENNWYIVNLEIQLNGH